MTSSDRIRIGSIAFLVACHAAGGAQAAQTVNPNFAQSCVNQGGTAGASNLVTDFDNGTFGSESGAADQSPNTDPYPATVMGGNYENFYDINHGDYSYIANPVNPRNTFQHAQVTDPIYGATGRFFASDPNVDTPTLNFSITNVVPNQNYELSFWAVNSEPNGTPNRVNAVVDGIVSYSTGLLQPVSSALPWQKYGFIFNAGNRTTIALSMASTETGSGGRDFYLDNVEMRQCTLSSPGTISGRIYADTDGNNAYATGTDGTLSGIDVQLFDTRGTASTVDDIYISVTSSGGDGAYSFPNLPANPNYQLRVLTNDPDLPSGASIGTPQTLTVSLGNGATVTDRNFGFDLSNAKLEAAKTVVTFDPNGYDLPGEDVAYTITVVNRGAGRADRNTLFLVDTLPADVIFRNDNFDAGTLDPVKFQQTGASLNFDYARDVGFALAGPKPANFGACNYTPGGQYDAAVRYICFAPNGRMRGGSPSPSFALSFRTQIK